MAEEKTISALGRLIEKKRLSKHLSRARLARKASVDVRTVYNIETGVTDTMRGEVFERMAAALDTTMTAIDEEASKLAGRSSLPEVIVSNDSVVVRFPEDLMRELYRQAKGREFAAWFVEQVKKKFPVKLAKEKTRTDPISVITQRGQQPERVGPSVSHNAGRR